MTVRAQSRSSCVTKHLKPAISRIWASVTLPTFNKFGVPLLDLRSTKHTHGAGGIFVMKEKAWSAYTEMMTA